MSDNNLGVGGLIYDKKKWDWPSEVNVLLALIGITIVFELIGRIFLGDSFLFNTQASVPGLFNTQRLSIIISQISIVGILAIGVTQVIISGGIDLSSGSVVGATVMITMSFAQTALVNGNPNPTAMFQNPNFYDLPVIVPVVIAIACGVTAGMINGALIAYTRIPPFIATLGMFASARGVSLWWTRGKPESFPIESYKFIGSGHMPEIIFIVLAIIFQFVLTQTKYGKHCYAV
ncbi:MAG: ABC transporter permease, partial [Aestuariivirga sp.]